MSHYSTTITYALIYNKPVFSPRWGLSKYFSLNYPSDIIYYCKTKEEFKKELTCFIPDSVKIEEYLEFHGIDINIDSIKLIVNEISKQVNA